MLESDYTENLFRSIDTIIAERIRQLPYDRTQIVEIIDNANAANGIYVVSPDNQYKEIVYSDNPTYKIGDKVYLLQVAGSERRFIIGLFLRVADSSNTKNFNRINRIYNE